MNRKMKRLKNVHFVGIGGSGMSGIAEVMIGLGYKVQGSDIKMSDQLERLRSLGAKIYISHSPLNIKNADALVVSSAISEKNSEVIEAKKKMLPVVARAEMLAELMRFYYSIAISGTHGKTTTTSLVATLLAEGNLDPTYIIGGCLKSSNSHAKLGAGEYLVAEADESDASFAHLKPMISVVTNIDLDHMSTYENNIEKLNSGFIEFLHNLPFYGLAIICIDDKGVKKIKHRIARSVITYGISEKADIRAENIEFKNTYTTFDLIRKNKTERVNIKINLPGLHNVNNALAAIAVATELNVSNTSIKKALKTFSGIDRRFQITENLPIKNGKVTLIDDYGHHPTEILATLNAIRSGWGDKKITLLFQPHRYTRTKDLFTDFVDALSMSDQLIVTKIYAAGESPIKGFSGESLVKTIKKEKKINPIYINSLEDSINMINQIVNDGDILLIMGAGDIGSFVKDLPKLIRVAL